MAAAPDRIGPRTQSRRYAALVLYQWKLTGESPASIKRHLLEDPKWLSVVTASLNGAGDDEDPPLDTGARTGFNRTLLDELLAGVPAHLTEIDAWLDRFLDRPISQVDPVELAILRLGAFEILYADNIPDRVAINEAVELTKLLGAHEGHKYVNGVLDKIARARAAAPMAAPAASGDAPGSGPTSEPEPAA